MRWLALVVVAVVTTTSCSLQLLAAPVGPTTLVARFENIIGLVQGHTVQFASVTIGSVTKVELDGYQAKVTMSIVDGRQVPAGSVAQVRRTSLLGEHYVDLQPPEGFDPATSAWLQDGDEVPAVAAAAEFEDLAGQASTVVAAASADDLAATSEAFSQALGGAGPQLNQLIRQSSELIDAIDARTTQLTTAIDNFGTLGQRLAPMVDGFGQLLDNVSDTVVMLNQDRDRFFTMLGEADKVAVTARDRLLVPYADEITGMLSDLRLLLGSLAGNRELVQSFIGNFELFTTRVQHAVSKGQLMTAAWIDPAVSLRLPPVLQGIFGA